MSKGYHHLTYSQRCQIFILKERGESISEIARQLGVHRSTVSRELRRGKKENGYHYDIAQIQARERRKASYGRKISLGIIDLATEKLKSQWSPEQISGWIRKNNLGAISHETIYRYVWTDKRQGGTLYMHLRHNGKKYNKRSSGCAGRGCIPGRVDIKERPVIVEKKERIGDWELDTIIGANHKGVIVSMVDRATKYTKLVKVPNKTAEEVSKALIKALEPIQEHVLTLTADNGKEFSQHQIIGKALGAQVYFATPYHSWERGLNEHTNGLVRQYFPKAKKLEEISEQELQEVELALNNRPRKVLLFETPAERFARMSGLQKCG
ncbi:MAG: IS30 family transposase [Chlamydiae bacterium]|jgi:IS30 family transposase|nr:IS30 family transposase [Chlamydiota bacterium]